MVFWNACDQLPKFGSVSAVIGSQALWWRMSLFLMSSNLWAHASMSVYVHGAVIWLQAGRWSSLSLFLSLESEWGCVYPTFTLKISSSDAADTGSFKPLSSSSSTVRSPEMALRISGPMSCNVRRPACTQTRHPDVLHFNRATNMFMLLSKLWNKAYTLHTPYSLSYSLIILSLFEKSNAVRWMS